MKTRHDVKKRVKKCSACRVLCKENEVCWVFLLSFWKVLKILSGYKMAPLDDCGLRSRSSGFSWILQENFLQFRRTMDKPPELPPFLHIWFFVLCLWHKNTCFAPYQTLSKMGMIIFIIFQNEHFPHSVFSSMQRQLPPLHLLFLCLLLNHQRLWKFSKSLFLSFPTI